MKTETDGILDAYQQQIVAARDVSEAFFEGTGRIENVLLEQTRRAFEEQLKFFQATAAVRDPQGLAAVHSAFFSHSPEDLIKAQRQILDVVIETQTKICDTVGKNMSALKVGAKPLWAASATNNPDGSAGALYSAWHKTFQDTVELASLGIKALPLSMPGSSNTSISRKESAHAKG
jgi:hypothetical protein